MNIFLYELKGYIKSFILWALTVFTLSILFMSFYPAFGKDASLMEKFIANYPEEMLKAFGMNTSLPLSSVLGYLAFIFVFIQICLAIQASLYGFGFLSKEERELTADFLFSKPISRSNIFLSKLLALFLILVLTNIVTYIATFVSLEIFKDGNTYEKKTVIIMLSSMILFQLFFVAFGMIVTVLTRKIRSVISYAMALAMGMYVLNALRAIIGGELLGYITPFYHFDVVYMLENASYRINLSTISTGFILVSILFSYYMYLRRNIHSL